MPEQTCELTPIPLMNLNETPEKTSVNGILQHYAVRVIRKNIKVMCIRTLRNELPCLEV